MAICTPILLGSQYPSFNMSWRGGSLATVSSSTEALLGSVFTLPGGMLGASDLIYIEAAGMLTGNTNTKNIYLRIGTNSGGLANTAIKTNTTATAANVSWNMMCSLHNLNSLSSQYFFDYSVQGFGTTPLQTFNTANTLYFSLSCSDSGSTAITLTHFNISIQRCSA